MTRNDWLDLFVAALCALRPELSASLARAIGDIHYRADTNPRDAARDYHAARRTVDGKPS
jgi:hypothetical protein